jgi:hypothetical protein
LCFVCRRTVLPSHRNSHAKDLIKLDSCVSTKYRYYLYSTCTGNLQTYEYSTCLPGQSIALYKYRHRLNNIEATSMSDHGPNSNNSNSNNLNNNNPQNGAGRPLPKRESDLFRQLVKLYEQKQYKKAVKCADTILKKFPKHGETLAMKGLTYNYMTVAVTTATAANSNNNSSNNNNNNNNNTGTSTAASTTQTTRREEAHALVKEGLKNDMRYVQ